MTFLPLPAITAACEYAASDADVRTLLEHLGLMREGEATEQAFTHRYARREEDLFSSEILWDEDVTLLLNPLGRALARGTELGQATAVGRNAWPAAGETSSSAGETSGRANETSGGASETPADHTSEPIAAGTGRIGNPPAGFDRVIATDGSCLKNPGPGGWAWVEQLTGARASGGATHTTNNVMELTALLEALTHVAPNESLLLRIDSQYVINTVTKWAPGWKRKGWKKADGSPVKNRELVEALLEAYQSRTAPTKVVWVKGHDGDAANELCDQLARSQAQRYQRSRT